ncbi:MAG: hypothetical protein FWH27_17965, partial [Planctomycetaceae bacterium]|nr:hypothetical protein [Planctomycetaceae bacterium]
IYYCAQHTQGGGKIGKVSKDCRKCRNYQILRKEKIVTSKGFCTECHAPSFRLKTAKEMQSAECRMQNAECRVQSAECRIFRS